MDNIALQKKYVNIDNIHPSLYMNDIELNQILTKKHDVNYNIPILERRFTYIIFIGYTIFLWVVMIGKISGNGFGDYLKHLTNWSWTIQALYFLLDSISVLIDKRGHLLYFIVTYLFWTVNAIVWIVFWLVFFVLGDNPDLLLKMSIIEGGKYGLGEVFVGDRVFHVIPALFFLAYFILRRHVIGYTIVSLMNPKSYSFAIRTTSLSIVTILGPVIVIFSYKVITDVYNVYGVTTPQITLVVIGLLILLVQNIIPFTLYYQNYKKVLIKHKSFH